MGLEEIISLEGHNDRVWGVEWRPQGDLLASCSGDRTVRIWAQQAGQRGWGCTAVLEDFATKAVRSMSWSPCGSKLATASFDGKSSVWRLCEGQWELVATVEGHENEVKANAWSPSGTMLATCSRDKSVWVWEVDPERNEFECIDVMQKHTQDVKHVTWHPSWEYPLLVSCSYDNSIILWTDNGTCDDWHNVQTLGKESGGHTSTVWQLSVHPDGSRMASCGDDCSVKVWSCGRASDGRQPNWAHVCTLSGYHERAVYSCHYSAGGLIASGSGDNSIRIFAEDAEAEAEPSSRARPFRQLACREAAHASDVNCVRWNPTRTGMLASAGDDEVVKIWQLRADP
eukprot:jgi/Tetstr1/426238/TSEL_016558.t1